MTENAHPAPPDPPVGPRRPRTRAAVRRAAWSIGGVALGASISAHLPALHPGAAWLADLAATAASWTALASLVLAGTLALLRLPRPALVTLLASAIAGSAVWTAPRLSPGPARTSESTPPLRVLSYNVRAPNPTPEKALDLVLGSGADVAVLVDAAPALVRAIRREGAAGEVFPWVLVRAPVPGETGWTLLLSRTPMHRPRGVGPEAENEREHAAEGSGEAAGAPRALLVEGVLAGVVESPWGDRVLIVATHPASPRTPARWARGNASLRRDLDSARELLAQGLADAAILAGDLNSGPAGGRSRLAAREGFYRTKPAFVAEGTWPAWSAWPMTLAIDDVLAGEGLGLGSWRVVGAGGSDHRAVVVELVRGIGR